MSELSDLYQEVILDHNRRPHNFRVIDNASARQEGYNPLCGDRLTLFLTLEGDVIKDAAFQGSGCAISKASASMMTEAVRGLGREQAEQLVERFHSMVTGHGGDPAAMGKLAAFAGVSEYPSRVKCATLAWHTLRAALENAGDTATTE